MTGPAEPFDQAGFRVRFDWGPIGLRRLALVTNAVVIVDVLRFTTAVEVAVGRGATVFPYPWDDDGAAAHALAHQAELAVGHDQVDEDHPWSLSPVGLGALSPGTRVVLPSPNGSALAFAAREAGAGRVVAGCLRNASAVGRTLDDVPAVAVIAAGERWENQTGPIRFAVEDLLGAGAVIAALGVDGASPEARVAAGAFEAASDDLESILLDSASGRELVSKGLADDVRAAARRDVSERVPVLDGEAFIDADGAPLG